MAEAQVLSIQDEEAARRKAEASTRFNEFISQWTLETVPAGDDGMKLLLQFADANPAAYRLAEQRGFTEMTHPMFNTLAKWRAYAVHDSTCPKCNEV
ncbi:hypothetical protein [Granulicella sp. L46]|uniref:hypothetical protein n=1 Tax=Granulicella sp. L46 TaxID=1641865 RepID=UPI00131A961F|nr:hypothetical protein [Granulicella sp. L46]